MTDTNTPPAAGERLEEIRALGNTDVWTRDEIAKVPAAIGCLLALVDKQAGELTTTNATLEAAIKRGFFEHERAESLERELAEAKGREHHGESPLNHKEAWDLAHMRKGHSNLARCYIDLSARAETARATALNDAIALVDKAANTHAATMLLIEARDRSLTAPAVEKE